MRQTTDRQMIVVFGIVMVVAGIVIIGIVRRNQRFIAGIRSDTNHRWDIGTGAKVICQKK